MFENFFRTFFKWNVSLNKRVQNGQGIPWAAPRDLLRAKFNRNPEKQPCQHLIHLVHKFSFTQINTIFYTYLEHFKEFTNARFPKKKVMKGGGFQKGGFCLLVMDASNIVNATKNDGDHNL